MIDRDGLDGFMRSLDPARWPDVIFHLKSFEDLFRSAHMEPGIVVFSNLMADTPRSSSFHDEPRIIVSTVIAPLLDALESAGAVENRAGPHPARDHIAFF